MACMAYRRRYSSAHSPHNSPAVPQAPPVQGLGWGSYLAKLTFPVCCSTFLVLAWAGACSSCPSRGPAATARARGYLLHTGHALLPMRAVSLSGPTQVGPDRWDLCGAHGIAVLGTALARGGCGAVRALLILTLLALHSPSISWL
jgi:hypothetical protein